MDTSWPGTETGKLELWVREVIAWRRPLAHVWVWDHDQRCLDISEILSLA